MPADGTNKPRIGVLGLGGVGGFVAAMLARQGQDVVGIARSATAERISARGVEIDSTHLGRFNVALPVQDRVTGALDYLFITTKAPDLEGALTRVADLNRVGVAIPLLNGLAHYDGLKALFQQRLVWGTIGLFQAFKDQNGVICHRSKGAHIDLGTDHGALQPGLADLVARLREAGISARIYGSETEAIWPKLVRLAPMSLAVAAADRPLGEVLDDPHMVELLRQAVVEVSALAVKAGYPADPGEVFSQIEALPKTLTTSLQRDLVSGHRGELDVFGRDLLQRLQQAGLGSAAMGALIIQAEQTLRRAQK